MRSTLGALAHDFPSRARASPCESKRCDGDANFAIEDAGSRVEFRAPGIVLEAGQAIELKPAGREPIPEQPVPGGAYLRHGAFERQHRIAAARQRRALEVAAKRSIRRNSMSLTFIWGSGLKHREASSSALSREAI